MLECSLHWFVDILGIALGNTLRHFLQKGGIIIDVLLESSIQSWFTTSIIPQGLFENIKAVYQFESKQNIHVVH